jgi:S-DNA-T family DNA segregation ATPase FtsK/SpoIIIE
MQALSVLIAAPGQAPQYVELTRFQTKLVEVGTGPDAHVRLETALCDALAFHVEISNQGYSLVPGRGVTFKRLGDQREDLSLNAGDRFEVSLSDGQQNELVLLHFVRPFRTADHRYTHLVSLQGQVRIAHRLAGQGISLTADEAAGAQVVLQRSGAGWLVNVQSANQHAVYLNGVPLTQNKPCQAQQNDFLNVAGLGFLLRGSGLLMDPASPVKLSGLSVVPVARQENQLSYPQFIRTTRLIPDVDTRDIEVLNPKSKPAEQEENILVTLMPSVTMLVLMVVMRGFMGGGGSFVLYSAGSMGVTILASLFARRVQKNKKIQQEKLRKQNYFTYIQNKSVEIADRRGKELLALNRTYRPIGDNLEVVRRFDQRLFDRSSQDEDFMVVRLGSGTIDGPSKIKISRQEYKDTEDDLMDMPEIVAGKYKTIEQAPIIANLRTCGSLGVVGTRELLYHLMRVMTMDLVVRHSYDDLRLYYLFEEEELPRFDWSRWLPHCYSRRSGIRNLMYDQASINQHLEQIYKLLSGRQDAKGGKDGGQWAVHHVLFVTNIAALRNHPISRYFKNASQYGFTFVFLSEYDEFLPAGCSQIIHLDKQPNLARLTNTAHAGSYQDFTYETVTEDMMREVTARLCPVEVPEISLESELVKSYTFFEMLGISSADQFDVRSAWAASRVTRSMAVGLGVKTKNELVTLDLHERFDGPHGLVAGTTGSGKSEILLSYMMNMALNFHPDEVGFLIIDFKGGGMANQLAGLPHLLGTITNIDGREINRSLKSIKAELLRRQRLFSQQDVNKIDDYIQAHKNNPSGVPVPLPHLIIVVDEFAELKSEQPEFMKELISAARIGRSLGVHLILATQKPAGVVDDQIWSNTNFRLCLRVQTREDSTGVLKSPLAAEIKEPGRAYMQVGNNEQLTLLQSAYSGVKVLIGGVSEMPGARIYRLNAWGGREVIYAPRKAEDSGPVEAQTQLDVMIAHVDRFCRENKVVRLNPICMPPLPETLSYPVAQLTRRDFKLPLGIYDDPDNQHQGPFTLDIASANTLVMGASQTGKTNFLQLIIRTLAENYSPAEAVIYIIDFDTMTLRNYDRMHHVGGVVLSQEDEKLKNLFKLLRQEVVLRREKLLEAGVTSAAAYRQAGAKDMPQIIVLIDNFAAFRELYEDPYMDEMQYLLREGLPLGITFVATGSLAASFGYRYMVGFTNRLCFAMSNRDEYMHLFDRSQEEPRELPGRGLVRLDKTVYEMQTPLAYEGAMEHERVAAIRDMVAQVNARYPSLQARRIPEIPSLLTRAQLAQAVPAGLPGYLVPIGLDFASIEPVYLDFESDFDFALIGKNEEGKLAFINNLLLTLQHMALERPVRVYLLDNPERKLIPWKQSPICKTYSYLFSDIERILEEAGDLLEERYDAMMTEGPEALERFEQLLILINNRDAFEQFDIPETLAAYNRIANKYSRLKVFFLYCDVQDKAISYSAPEPLRRIRDSKHAILFSALSEIKAIDLSMSTIRAFPQPLAGDEAYYCNDNELLKLKALQPPDDAQPGR